MILLSPAKINLFFRVLGRRPDGYHEIVSLYQAISLFDRISIDLAQEDRLSCSDPSIPCDEKNLAYRARDLFRKKSGIVFHASIHLQKEIPIQSGLGGGSSNGATILYALNALTGQRISEKRLMQWGAELGSDVPFFFSSGRANCSGRGEIIDSLPPVEPIRLWIAKPPLGLSTPEVYRAWVPAPPCENDLESAAFSIMPRLRDFKEELLGSGFEKVVMTGSGTAFYCIGEMQKRVEGIFMKPVEFTHRNPGQWYEEGTERREAI